VCNAELCYTGECSYPEGCCAECHHDECCYFSECCYMVCYFDGGIMLSVSIVLLALLCCYYANFLYAEGCCIEGR
jgi:hypothetical protein